MTHDRLRRFYVNNLAALLVADVARFVNFAPAFASLTKRNYFGKLVKKLNESHNCDPKNLKNVAFLFDVTL